MIDFDDELRAALRREAPSPEFLARVLERTRRIERPARGWRTWAAGALAASLLVGSLALADLDQQRERARARMARAQVIQALQIASSKLRVVESRVKGLNQ